MTGTPAYRMLARGRFRPDELDVHYAGGPSPCAAELGAEVEAEWHDRVRRAAREGVRLTNGRLLRLASFGVHAGRLALELGDTTYAEFLATNHEPQRRARLAPGDLANPLGTSALVVTRDGTCVLGLRGGEVLHYRGQVHTIGGMFEAEDVVDGRVDGAKSLLREVHEELGVGARDVAGLVCRGLMLELESLQPELMFEVALKLDAEELERRWQTAESRAEHVHLLRVRDDVREIRAFLGDGRRLAPQALAALELRAELG